MTKLARWTRPQILKAMGIWFLIKGMGVLLFVYIDAQTRKPASGDTHLNRPNEANPSSPTADQQEMKETSLSTSAKKTITHDGKLTSKGPVRSEQETRKIEKNAISLVGADVEQPVDCRRCQTEVLER